MRGQLSFDWNQAGELQALRRCGSYRPQFHVQFAQRRLLLWNLDPDVFTDALVLLKERAPIEARLGDQHHRGSLFYPPPKIHRTYFTHDRAHNAIAPDALARRGYRALKDHGESIFTDPRKAPESGYFRGFLILAMRARSDLIHRDA